MAYVSTCAFQCSRFSINSSGISAKFICNTSIVIVFASRTRSVLTCTICGLGRAAFAAAKMVSASFNAGPVLSYITAVLARGFKFSIANFCPAADVDVNTRPSVTFIFFARIFEAPFGYRSVANSYLRCALQTRVCLHFFYSVRSYADFSFLAGAVDSFAIRCKGNAPLFPLAS